MSKPGRNDPCSCGSGKKYKHCCLLNVTDTPATLITAQSRKQLNALMQRAFEHQQAGQAQEAIALLEQVLQQSPEHPDALNLMGMVAIECLGQADLAIDLFLRAVQINPQNPLYAGNLAKALFVQQKYAEAADCLRHVLLLEPESVQAHYDLAATLQNLDENEEAINYCRAALKLSPNDVDTCYLLGELLLDQGREALVWMDKTISIDPTHAKAHFYRGFLLKKEGKYREAIQSYYKAISCQSDMVEAYHNLGRLLIQEGNLQAALSICQVKAQLTPDDAETHRNLGMLFQELWRFEESEASIRRAIALQPDHVLSYNILGSVLLEQGRLSEAVESYRQAILIKPESEFSHSSLLFAGQYLPDLEPEEMFNWALDYGAKFEAPFKPMWHSHANVRDPARRLKIGYVSGDFRDHAAMNFFEPILSGHDRNAFEIFCYYTFQIQDQTTEHLKTLADHWIPCVNLSDGEMSERIRADGIDILIDLSGHTAHNRLLVFARKPAPVQATWIGYAGTTGLSAMDYRITDAYMDPPGLTERFHTEKLIRLPYSATYTPPADCPEVNALPSLATGQITLASLNAPKKMNQNVANLWGRILNALPGARLMLGGISDDDIRRQVMALFERAGVAEGQLVMQPRVHIQAFLQMHHQIDLALDPFPYNGGTTSMHSLWMGVPYVTLSGRNSISRVGSAVLMRAGLDHFVTRTEEEYFERVLEILSDLPSLSSLRQSLRGRILNESKDSRVFVHELESAYRQMWRTWCEAGA